LLFVLVRDRFLCVIDFELDGLAVSADLFDDVVLATAAPERQSDPYSTAISQFRIGKKLRIVNFERYKNNRRNRLPS